MKKTLVAVLILTGLIHAYTLSAADLTREIDVPAGGGLVAVPNGYRLKGVSAGVSVGEASVLNHVTLLPIAVAAAGRVTLVFAEGGETFAAPPRAFCADRSAPRSSTPMTSP